MPEATFSPVDSQSKVTLDEVTTYLGGSLLRLVTGKDPRGLVPMTVNTTRCLLVPAGAEKTMIALEGSDSEDKSLRDKCLWEGKENAYGNFQQILSERSSGDERMMQTKDANKWRTNEESSTIGVETDKWPAESRLSQAEPSEFDPPKKAGESGAKLVSLPRPYKQNSDVSKDR